MKHSSLIVLKSLLYGLPVELEEGYVFKLFSPGEKIVLPSGEYYSEKYFLGIEMLKNNEKVYVGANLDLVEFIELTEKLEHDKIVILAEENVFNEIERGINET